MTECKKNAVKIDKGALKLGIWIEAGEKAFYLWRHWGEPHLFFFLYSTRLSNHLLGPGCTTPKVIADLDEVTDGDMDNVDGYDELDEEDQARVRQAIADGHVADEDLVSIVRDPS